MKPKRNIVREILDRVVDPSMWQADPGHKWLLTPRPDGSLLFQAVGEFGPVSGVLHEPEKIVAALHAEQLKAYRETALSLGVDLGEIMPRVEGSTEAAAKLFFRTFGLRLLDAVSEAVEETIVSNQIAADAFDVVELTRGGDAVEPTKPRAGLIGDFLGKITSRRRARFAERVSKLPKNAPGDLLTMHAEYLIENSPDLKTLTYETLAARLSKDFGHKALDSLNLKKHLNRRGVYLRARRKGQKGK